MSNGIISTKISLMTSLILTNNVTNQNHFTSELTGQSLQLFTYLELSQNVFKRILCAGAWFYMKVLQRLNLSK